MEQKNPTPILVNACPKGHLNLHNATCTRYMVQMNNKQHNTRYNDEENKTKLLLKTKIMLE